jgi:hypothetical protein
LVHSGQVGIEAAQPRASASRRTAGDTPCAERSPSRPPARRQLVDEHGALLAQASTTWRLCTISCRT